MSKRFGMSAGKSAKGSRNGPRADERRRSPRGVRVWRGRDRRDRRGSSLTRHADDGGPLRVRDTGCTPNPLTLRGFPIRRRFARFGEVTYFPRTSKTPLQPARSLLSLSLVPQKHKTQHCRQHHFGQVNGYYSKTS
jgi:hypothetical protein